MTVRKSETDIPVPLEEWRQWERETKDLYPSQHAWAKLVLELRIAKRAEELKKEDPRLPQGLTGIVRLVNALSDFLHSHEIIQQEQLAAPLLRLATALVDISGGRRPAVLTPVRQGRGGLQRNAANANMMAIAARAAVELMAIEGEGKLTRAQATAKVAGVIRSARLPGHAKCNAAKVERWLDTLRAAEAGQEKVAEVALGRWQAPLPPEAGSTARDRASFLLHLLRTGPALHWE